MIIIIFCRHDSILTQGWRDNKVGHDGRALLRDCKNFLSSPSRSGEQFAPHSRTI
jgi:hypothetical protein